MTELVPELSTFPVYGTFDGELVAVDADGAPDFPLICERLDTDDELVFYCPDCAEREFGDRR
jgi:hypothetical protein